MNYECDFILDLLPLYAENIASKSTCKLVEEHIADCESCKEALQDLRQVISIPVETDTTPFLQMRNTIRKKAVLAVLTVVFTLLAIISGYVVCTNIPVWLTPQEAIADIRQNGDKLSIMMTDRFYGAYQFEDGVLFQGLRIMTPKNKFRIEQQDGLLYEVRLEDGDPFWYLGGFAGDAHILLAESEAESHAPVTLPEINWNIAYLFWGSLILGITLLVLLIVFWTRRCNRLLLAVAVLALCCAGSCWFVTGGRFMAVWDPMLPVWTRSGLVPRLVCIGVMMLLSWSALLGMLELIKMYHQEKRRFGDETEL